MLQPITNNVHTQRSNSSITVKIAKLIMTPWISHIGGGPIRLGIRFWPGKIWNSKLLMDAAKTPIRAQFSNVN